MRDLTKKPVWFVFWTFWCTFWAILAARLALDSLAQAMDGPQHTIMAIAMMVATVLLAIGALANMRGMILATLHLGIQR